MRAITSQELRKRRNAALFRGVVRGWTEDRPPITTHELDMAERMDACDVNGERRLSSFCLNSPEPRLGVYSDEPHPKSHLQTTVVSPSPHTTPTTPRFSAFLGSPPLRSLDNLDYSS